MNIQQLLQLQKKEPEQWNFSEVGQWLQVIYLAEYKEIFEKSKIDGTMLCVLTEEDIQVGLNISNFMHRKRLIKAINVLQQYQKQFKKGKNINEFQQVGVNKDSINLFQKKPGKDSKMEIEYLSEVYNEITDSNMEVDYSQSESLQVSKKLFHQGTTQNPFINNHGGHQQTGNNLFQQSSNPLPQQSFQIKQKLKNKENILDQSKDDLSQMISKIIVPQQLEKEKVSKVFPIQYEEESKLNNTQIEEEEQEKKQNQSLENPNSPGYDIEKELILQPIEGSYKYIFCVVDNDTTIGRHSSNKLVICDESVSRYHCQIIQKKGNFQLQDVGSTTGTYLKIKQKQLLQKGMTIEMGNNQFLLEKMTIKSGSEGTIQFRVTEGEEEFLNLQYTIKNKGSIGRKTDSTICFEDDVHLSNLHAVFSMENGKFVFEDMSSTNGSWLRLSNEGQKSLPYDLKHKDEIKIGLQCTFKAKIKNKNDKIQYKEIVDTPSEKLFENNRCDICYEKEKNALLMPCKHNCTCILCAKNLTQCPICRGNITDFIKIYKS